MRRTVLVLILVLCALGLFGCGKKQETEETSASVTVKESETPTPTPEPEDPIPEGTVISYLSGEYVPESQARRRPVAVMLNNIQDACPQCGISCADVVYEAPVEGNITRLMGIFERYDGLDKIGSVRSCREYYIFFAQEFDSIYVHYGQAVYALDYLDLDFINNLNGLGPYESDIFYRTSDRSAPHNAYTSAAGIERGIADYGYSETYAEDYDGHYQFADVGESIDLHADDNAFSAVSADLSCFSYNKPSFSYDAESGRYLRFQFDDIQIDEMTGQQLAYDNILIQIVPYVPYDDHGYLNLDVLTGAEGYYLTHGKGIRISWVKDSPWGVTHYFNENGQEITLNTGQTFVEIVLEDTADQLTFE